MPISISGSDGLITNTVDAAEIKQNGQILDTRGQTITVVNYNQALTSDLSGYGALGDVTIERVSARWRGYEGQYWSSTLRTNNAGIFASSIQTATDTSPYDYGTHNKGPRSGRGGLLDGWGGVGGAIMKINKPANGSTNWNNGVYIHNRPSLTHLKAKTHRFRAYVYVDYGTRTYGMSYLDDSTYSWTVPTLQEWHYIDVIIGGSDIMHPRQLINIRTTEATQLFMAFPTVEAIYGPVTTNGNDAQFINLTG